MKTLIANDIKINYRLDPRKDGAKDAPVVMLSNSLLSSYAMWDDQMDALTEDFQVLRYDTRGHGGTEAPAEAYSIEIFVTDVIGLLDKLVIAKVHFVGLSMGGFIAQLLAATHPERVLSVTLCDTACVMPPAALWNERIEAAERGGVEAIIDGTLKRWFTPPFHKTDAAAVDKIRDMIRATGVVGFANCAKAIRDMSQCHILGDIKSPTLVIVGADDPACPVTAAETLNNGISGSRLVILEDAAHLPNIEKKSEFNAALLEFLKEQPK